jgi:exosortase
VNRSAILWAALALLTLTAWSHASALANLFQAWQRSDDYSACLIVPLLAGFLLWRERQVFRQCSPVPCWWGGIALLVLAEMAWTWGMLSFRASPGQYALVLTIASLVLMTAGWQVFRRVLWILLFLLLMVPLPGRVHNLISLPLQSIATTGSVVLLEAFGVRVSQQGNIITLNRDTPLAVAEACSGLRMLIAFVIAAALIAYLVKRPRWQKAVLLASSIPVAVICNVVRIVATAILTLYVSSEVAQSFFHDIAGFVMISVAVSLLFGEIRLMDGLIVPEPNTQQPHVIVRAKSNGKAGTRSSRNKRQ